MSATYGVLKGVEPVWIALGLISGVMLAFIVSLWPDRTPFVKRVDNVACVPGGLPIVGNYKLVWKALRGLNQQALDKILQDQIKVGPGGMPFAFHVPSPSMGGRCTVLNRPEYLQVMQGSKTYFPHFVKGEPFRACLSDLLLEGIFVADGESWKRQRKLASRIFSVNNFRSHVQFTVQRELETLIKLGNDISTRGSKVNLPDIFFRYTLETFGLMAFGAELGGMPSTVDGLQHQVPFAVAMDKVQSIASQRFMNPIWKMTEIFSQTGKDMRQSLQVVRQTCYTIIDKRMENQAKGGIQGAQSSTGKDLLQLFLDQGFDRDELLAVVLNFLIAGRDTTAQGLTWCMYLLHSAPEAVTKLRAEVASVLGEGQDQRLMEYDDLKSMPYLQAVFNETLRLQPPVAKNLKYVTEDTVIQPYAEEKIVGGTEQDAYGTGAIPSPRLPDVFVQKGTTVFWSDYMMARMPEVWGPDCTQFKPERFLQPDGSIKQYSPYVFHSFNAGYRACLGQTLAMYEGCAVLAALLGQFNVKLDDDELARYPPSYFESLTLPMSNPYSVMLTKRMVSSV